MQFHDLKLIQPLLRAVQSMGYETPTPIQAQAIPHVLQGKDLIGCAQTGTGKTAAFALPILQRLVETPPARQGRHIRTLILTPTRELATQIGDGFTAFGRHTNIKNTVIFGGVGQNPQVQAVRNGVDVLIATPGRLLDLMQQGLVRLNNIEIFVLDEADRMLDMGFIHDVRRIIATLPTQRQTLLFSATMPPDIVDLAQRILIEPVSVEVTPQSTTVEKIAQSVFFVDKGNKRPLLEHLLRDQGIRRVLVFTRTKHGANKLAEQLERGGVRADAIHGNKSQGARERALANFKSGRSRVLVATDIAARGIDIADVTHVINYELPNEPESYVHRIGRTARAGASGIAYSFCDAEEREYLRDIEKLIRLNVPVVSEHPYVSSEASAPLPVRGGGNGNRSRSGGNGQNGGQRRDQRQHNQPRRDGGQRPAASGQPRAASGGQQPSGQSNGQRPAQHTSQPSRSSNGTHSQGQQRRSASQGNRSQQERRRNAG